MNQSYINGSVNMVLGNYLPIHIVRYSTGCTHTLNLYINDTWIKRIEGIGTYGEFTFSITETEQIATILNTATSGKVEVLITTYYQGVSIGVGGKTGTITIPSTSEISAWGNCYLDATWSGTYKTYNTFFNTDCYIKTNDGSTTLATVFSNGTGNGNFNFDMNSIKDAVCNLIPNSNTYTCKVYVYTQVGSTQVGSPRTYYVDLYVPESATPTFNGIGYYMDSNSTTVEITGNNSYIIQNNSTLTVGFDRNNATPQLSAELSKVSFECAGKSATADISSSSAEVSLGTIDANNDQTLKITVIDSRGKNNSITQTVKIVPYSAPKLSVSAERTNNFESETTLTVKSSCSPITVNSTIKNSISSIKYQYKENGGSYNALTSATYSGFPYVSSTSTLTLDNTKSFTINVVLDDRLSTVIQEVSVASGVPLFFLDTDKNSIGVNTFPSNNNSFEVSGNILSNNISKNSITFTNNTLKVENGTAYIDSTSIANKEKGNVALWSGSLYMNGEQSISPTKKLSECTNGWCLIWARYENNENKGDCLNFWYIPKSTVLMSIASSPYISQTMHCFSTPVHKSLYINDTTISGVDANVATQTNYYNYYENNKLVLIRVIEF